MLKLKFAESTVFDIIDGGGGGGKGGKGGFTPSYKKG